MTNFIGLKKYLFIYKGSVKLLKLIEVDIVFTALPHRQHS